MAGRRKNGWRRPTHRLMQQLYLKAWFGKYRTDLDKEAGEEKRVAGADS